MHELDPKYLGYWTPDEVLAFLDELLTLERQGTRAFAEIIKAADLRTADAVLECELMQASLCVFIREQVKARGGRSVPPARLNMVKDLRTKPSLEDTVAAATCNQNALA
jgi:hypothetical protein